MERQYHLKIREKDIGKYVILTGDPGRCESIAGFFDEAYKVADNREFVTFSGKIMETDVSVTSTGIGGPSAAIAMEELAACGAHTFIRVGTCGGINMKVKSSDCVVSTGAVRNEGTSREYAPVEYPAVSDFFVTTALVKACEALNIKFHCGVVQCKDSFYGQHSPDRMPVSNELLYKWESWKKLGVLVSEMESAALFTVAGALNVRCGSILQVLWNQERKKAGLMEDDILETDVAVRAAIQAVRLLIKED